MANLNMLKIFSGHIITTSKMPASAKNQLLNYVKEGTESQVKAFLLDGEIMKDPNDIVCKKIIDERFYSSDLPEKLNKFSTDWNEVMNEAGGRIAQVRKSASSLLGATSMGIVGGAPVPVGPVLWGIYRKIRSKYDKCTKHCGTFELNTARRQLCMAKCKVSELKEKLKAAEKSKNNSELEKIKSKLHKAEYTLHRYEENFRSRGSKV